MSWQKIDFVKNLLTLLDWSLKLDVLCLISFFNCATLIVVKCVIFDTMISLFNKESSKHGPLPTPTALFGYRKVETHTWQLLIR